MRFGKVLGGFVEFRSGRSIMQGRKCNQLARRLLRENVMAQYLVAIYHLDDYDPSIEDEAMSRDIDALNNEMEAARVRIFVGGLSPVRSARSLRARSAGKVLVIDGPYIETNEHIGGFWVLEAASLDEALAWGRKAAVACRAPVEVCPFNYGETRSKVQCSSASL
jgi:hypothetical protein